MLEQMHRHMKWIMWVIVGLVTVAFLFFGIFPSTSGRGIAASVNGDVITDEEWNRAYQNLHEMFRDTLKGQMSEGFDKTLRAQALQGLITDRLLIHEAEDLGLRVTDQELQSAIIKIPVFNQQGVFNRRAYDMYLRQVNKTPAEFETEQRGFLLRQKLERIVEDSVDVTDAEVASAYAARNPKAKAGDLEKNKAQFKQSLLEERKRAALQSYVSGLGQKAKIKMSESAALR